MTASSYLAGSQPSDAFSASNAELSFEDSPVRGGTVFFTGRCGNGGMGAFVIVSDNI